MMSNIDYKLKVTSRFVREQKNLTKKNNILKKKVSICLKKMEIDPFSSSLNTHIVKIRSFGRVYSTMVTGDIRILWDIRDGNRVILFRIGGHSGSSKVYK